MNDDSELRKLARDSMAQGSLPNSMPAQTWGGPGTGTICALCGSKVGSDQLEFEVEFARETGAAGRYHLHVACFSAWDAERRAGAARRIPPLSIRPGSSQRKGDGLPSRAAGGKMPGHERESADGSGAA